MAEQPRVFGIGMSKTGTTTLGSCLEILGFTPHIGFEPQLKRWVERGGDVEKVLRFAERFRSFEDSPWYLVYEALDQRFPGSKFVLTVRKNSTVHATSSWHHGARRGVRQGPPTDEYMKEKIRIYEEHNRRVQAYFRNRPDDLLVICWEDGDGWEKLCRFLSVPVPSVPIPHCNQGRYRPKLPVWIADSRPYNAVVRTVHQLSLTPLARRVRALDRIVRAR